MKNSINILLISATMLTSLITNGQDCSLKLDPIEQGIKPLLDRLKQDPLHEGLQSYIKDIDKVDAEINNWLIKGEQWSNEKCKPYLLELADYEEVLSAYTARCPHEIADPNLLAECQQTYYKLVEWEIKVNHMEQDQISGGDELNKLGAEILERALSSTKAAEDILSNTEKAFWLLCEQKKEDVQKGTITDCDALTDVLNALGNKVSWDLDEISTYAGRVLANGVSFTIPKTEIKDIVIKPGLYYVAFGQSGFKTQYQDNDINSQNQVRHFIGYFVLGLKHPQFTDYANYIANYRDFDQSADILLGVLGMNLGKAMYDQPSRLHGLTGTIQTGICE